MLYFNRLGSGGAWRVTIWTDGDVFSSSYDPATGLYQCRACAAYIWVDEIEVLDSVRDPPLDESMYELQGREVPCFAREISSTTDWPAALASAPWRSRAEELHLRVAAMRAWNWDHRNMQELQAGYQRFCPDPNENAEWVAKHCASVNPSLPDPALENLGELVAMLRVSDEEEQLLKAEALRELGLFEECLAVLEAPVEEKHQRLAAVIAEWAQQGDRMVRLVAAVGWRKDAIGQGQDPD
jgi:hypothetical protein